MGKGKRYKKKSFEIKKIKLKPRFFLNIILVISITYNVKLSIKIREQEQLQQFSNTIVVDNKIEVDENKTEETEKMVQVKSLKKQYTDIVGWIEIEGTNINYPVVQGKDNDYYITHDYKGKITKKGSIFLDKDYDWDIPSSNLLLYGHNNKNDTTMFSDLLKYKDKEFYKKHPTIKFTTTKEDSEYEIIAAFLSRVYYKNEQDVFRYYYFINANNEEEYNKYIENAKKSSLYDTGKTAKYGEQLITLSTCEYSQEDGRFAIVGRKK